MLKEFGLRRIEYFSSLHIINRLHRLQDFRMSPKFQLCRYHELGEYALGKTWGRWATIPPQLIGNWGYNQISLPVRSCLPVDKLLAWQQNHPLCILAWIFTSSPLLMLIALLMCCSYHWSRYHLHRHWRTKLVSFLGVRQISQGTASNEYRLCMITVPCSSINIVLRITAKRIRCDNLHHDRRESLL